MKNKTLAAIEQAHERRQGTGFRNHLGASLIGRVCPRHLWYVFRWARRSRHAARLLRLFQRGEEEESRLVSFLRKAGVHVIDKDPNTGKQFRVGDHDGHFGGSLDGKLFDTPDFPLIEVLGEFKTHNDKSFKAVVKEKVREAKFEHFVQMQIYMKYEKLPAALYFAVNKNDDEIDIQVVEYDERIANQYIERAGKIIHAPYPPERTPNASPGWYICRFCDHNDICHNGRAKEKNCRTCIHSRPHENNTWLCTRYTYVLDEAHQRLGCQDHSMIPEA